jgi:hypothetical protein
VNLGDVRPLIVATPRWVMTAVLTVPRTVGDMISAGSLENAREEVERAEDKAAVRDVLDPFP